MKRFGSIVLLFLICFLTQKNMFAAGPETSEGAEFYQNASAIGVGDERAYHEKGGLYANMHNIIDVLSSSELANLRPDDTVVSSLQENLAPLFLDDRDYIQETGKAFLDRIIEKVRKKNKLDIFKAALNYETLSPEFAAALTAHGIEQAESPTSVTGASVGAGADSDDSGATGEAESTPVTTRETMAYPDGYSAEAYEEAAQAALQKAIDSSAARTAADAAVEAEHRASLERITQEKIAEAASAAAAASAARTAAHDVKVDALKAQMDAAATHIARTRRGQLGRREALNKLLDNALDETQEPDVDLDRALDDTIDEMFEEKNHEKMAREKTEADVKGWLDGILDRTVKEVEKEKEDRERISNTIKNLDPWKQKSFKAFIKNVYWREIKNKRGKNITDDDISAEADDFSRPVEVIRAQELLDLLKQKRDKKIADEQAARLKAQQEADHKNKRNKILGGLAAFGGLAGAAASIHTALQHRYTPDHEQLANMPVAVRNSYNNEKTVGELSFGTRMAIKFWRKLMPGTFNLVFQEADRRLERVAKAA